MRVRELMSRDVAAATPDMPLKDAARLMTGRGISGLPVIDDEDRPVGVLSEADFVARAGGARRAGLLSALFEPKALALDATTAGDAMTSPAVTVDGETSHREAARLMDKRKVKRLPVVDTEGRLIGIVSRSDILAVFARPDGAIEQDIRHHVIGRVMMLDQGIIAVTVTDGDVALSGTLQTRTEARLLEELTAKVDGVLAVKSNLRWLVDERHQSVETVPIGGPRPRW